MTDVRLTATNPEDSSVVPVACNEKGELKLEEPIDNSFDGNLDGDLSVSGSAEFAGDIDTGGNKIYGSWGVLIDAGSANGQALQVNQNGAIAAKIDANGGAMLAKNKITFSDNGTASFGGAAGVQHTLQENGTATFAGGNASIEATGAAEFAGPIKASAPDGSYIFHLDDDGVNQGGFYQSGLGTSLFLKAKATGTSLATVALNGNDGSATFAGGKAGITAEGNLWCTTRRGDTVILDATSNGLATWADYTPTSFKDLMQEKLEEWSEKDKPSVSDLDPLENGQIRE